jgi:hypothetical protein
MRPGQILVEPLDLPLAGRRCSGPHGRPLGVSGDWLCLLQPGAAVVRVDLRTGESENLRVPPELLRLPERPEGVEHLRRAYPGHNPQAAMTGGLDGLRLYLASPGGVAGLNLRSGEALFAVDWPAPLTVEPPGAVFGQGSPYGMPYQGWDHGWGLCRVGDGVLYATPEADRLVALETAGGEAP